MRKALFGVILAVPFLLSAAGAVEVSTKNNIGGHLEYAGYTIVPVHDVAASVKPGDHAAAQMFELIRPSNQAVTIGRLYTSCTCIRMETEKKSYGAGERVLITVRNVQPSKGQTYPFYVQIASPIRVVLRHDAYVISDRFLPNAAPAATLESTVPETAVIQEVPSVQPVYAAPTRSEPAASGERYLTDLDLQ